MHNFLCISEKLGWPTKHFCNRGLKIEDFGYLALFQPITPISTLIAMNKGANKHLRKKELPKLCKKGHFALDCLPKKFLLLVAIFCKEILITNFCTRQMGSPSLIATSLSEEVWNVRKYFMKTSTKFCKKRSPFFEG